MQKFMSYENKNFIRLNENYYGNNQRIKNIMRELSQMFSVHFLEIGVS